MTSELELTIATELRAARDGSPYSYKVDKGLAHLMDKIRLHYESSRAKQAEPVGGVVTKPEYYNLGVDGEINELPVSHTSVPVGGVDEVLPFAAVNNNDPFAILADTLAFIALNSMATISEKLEAGKQAHAAFQRLRPYLRSPLSRDDCVEVVAKAIKAALLYVEYIPEGDLKKAAIDALKAMEGV